MRFALTTHKNVSKLSVSCIIKNKLFIYLHCKKQVRDLGMCRRVTPVGATSWPRTCVHDNFILTFIHISAEI